MKKKTGKPKTKAKKIPKSKKIPKVSKTRKKTRKASKIKKVDEIPEDVEKREIIQEIAEENDTDCVILENPSYPKALIGYMFDENGKMRTVYSEELMIKDLLDQNPEWTMEDALEWYDFNTSRGVPYCHTDTALCPIIIHTFD